MLFFLDIFIILECQICVLDDYNKILVGDNYE